MTHSEFALIVAALAESHACSVTSWWRSERRNHLVGGHQNSYHLRGLAADFTFDTPNDRAEFIERARNYPLDVVPEDDHVHIEPRPGA